jgi:hypothetical protein
MPTIVNAAPMVLPLGIQDNSAATQAVQSEDIPTHCAKVYLFAQKGPVGVASLVAGAGMTQLFGSDTFDLRKSYATHQTVLANILSGAGNAQMIERVIPADAGPKSNFCLWLDVLPTQIPLYQRNSDGSYILDIAGQPQAVAGGTTVAGYKVKWVMTSTSTGTALDSDGTLFGNKVSMAGDQTDGTTTSTRYPILEFWASWPGAYANNAGFRLFAPTVTSSDVVDSKLLTAVDAYPFMLQAISRVDASSTPTIVPTLTGGNGLKFVFAPGVINPYTDAQVSLDDTFDAAWGTKATEATDAVYADLSGMHLYRSYLNTVITEFFTTEMDYLEVNPTASIGLDFTNNEDSYKWLFNIVSGISSTNIPYNTFLVDSLSAGSVPLTDSTNLFASSGSDGTMSNANFNTLVKTAVSEYGSLNTPLLETAINVESIMYDTGFSLAVKQAMINFISQRKDTFLVLSTYDVDGPELEEADEASIGASLRTALELAPESTYYGTPVVRGMVIGRYGRLLGYNWYTKLPLTLEIAAKSAAMMGASNGIWKKTYLFDKAPNSVVTMFTDLNVDVVPASQRNTDWANGLNYPLPYSRKQSFFPALKTAYNDDTSVLTSYFTAMVCCELEKVGQRAWRNFSGATSLTPGQLVENVNKFVSDDVAGRFAGLAVIVPNTVITDADELRGYSWTLNIAAYFNNMKTVMTLSIQAFRTSQLTTTN